MSEVNIKKENSAKERKKKNRNSLSTLFNNDRFLMVFSFVLSFFMWTAISASSGETANYPISDISVTMDLSEEASADNLTVVSINGVAVDKFKATVKVKGNSVTVGSLTASDIEVYGANLGNIVTSGTYNVTLMARKLGVKTNYDIVSLNPSEITVVVDRNVSKDFEIESQITASSPAEYYMGSPSFSSKTVTVSGPEQSVSKVAKAVVVSNLEKELTSTTVINNLDVILLDSGGNKIEDDSLTVDPITVDVTIPVLVKKTVPIVLNCENVPNSIDLNNFIKVEPSEIEIAASEDVIDSVENISIGTLDFNKLSYGTSSLEFELVMPEGVRNLNSIDKAVTKFDFSSYSTKTFVVTAFAFRNVPDGLIAEYSPYRNIIVRVIGPKSEISEMTSSDILANIDLSEATVGTFDVTLDISINGITSCWVYDTYQLNVTVNYANSVSSSIVSEYDETDEENYSSREENSDLIQ